MTIKRSQAFAAMRQSLLSELSGIVQDELVPQFNSEAEDIRREHEAMRLNPKKGEALADHRKRARIADMVVRRKVFIDDLQSRLQITLGGTVMDYKGEIVEEIEEGTGKVLSRKAVFPDGTTAKMPKSLWIDYRQFQRV